MDSCESWEGRIWLSQKIQEDDADADGQNVDERCSEGTVDEEVVSKTRRESGLKS